VYVYVYVRVRMCICVCAGVRVRACVRTRMLAHVCASFVLIVGRNLTRSIHITKSPKGGPGKNYFI